MLRIRILTLFPEMFAGVLNESIVKRAQDQHLAEIEVINFRDYATDKHRTVDDYPFGGGAGMLLKPAPIFDAVDSVVSSLEGEVSSGDRDRDGDTSAAETAEWSEQPVHTSAAETAGLSDETQNNRREIVLMSPQGEPFCQSTAEGLASLDELILICGHYEGFDERVREFVSTREISVGDFVLTGGEIPAMAIMDAVVRLLPGALGNENSAAGDSFSSGLLEYPQYTRPAEYRGYKVPDVLLSGDHAKIAQWRHREALYRTWCRRPDLLKDRTLTEEEQRWVDGWTSSTHSSG